MKRLFVLSTLAASLVVSAGAPAQAAGKQPKREDAPVERLLTTEGVISGVDPDAVELRTQEGTMDFELDGSVRIYREGKQVSRAAIQLGERARATYQQRLDGVQEDEQLVRLDLEPGSAR